MYLHAEEDQYYQRLLEAGVPVSWIAPNLASSSMGTGRKLAYRIFQTFPGSKQFIRKLVQPLLTGRASRHYEKCREFLTNQKPGPNHVESPETAPVETSRAGRDAGIPVVLQQLGR